jgi:hypothetical protein
MNNLEKCDVLFFQDYVYFEQNRIYVYFEQNSKMFMW